MDYRAHKRVPLGTLLISPVTQKHAEAHGHCLALYIDRHARGDWGDVVTAEEWRANDIGLRTGSSLCSGYTLSCGAILLINTDFMRASTFVQVAQEDEDDC